MKALAEEDDDWSSFLSIEELMMDDELDILLIYTVQYGNYLRELEKENDENYQDSSIDSNEDDDNLRLRNNKKRRRVVIDCAPRCLEDYFKSIGCKK
jgi:hypothetical protein